MNQTCKARYFRWLATSNRHTVAVEEENPPLEKSPPVGGPCPVTDHDQNS